MSSVETVKVTTALWKEPVVINKSDYDPKVHKLVEGDKPKATRRSKKDANG